jgi:hypothetical protein
MEKLALLSVGRDGEGKWWDQPDPDFNEDNWG